MADVKKLQTRIALKYDSYAAWTSAPGKDLVLLAGEIGICQIGEVNTASRVAPTVLFKVGDGTSTFEQLPWASAKAADVYTWAKASDVVVDGKTLKFVGGAVDAEGNKVDKVVTFNFATPEEVAAAVKVVADDLAELDARVADVEAKFTGDGSVGALIEAAKEAAIAAAAEDAATKDAAVLVAAQKYTDDAVTEQAGKALEDAKAYTDGEVDKLEAEDARLAGLIGDNAEAIQDVADDLAQELLDRAAADQAIEAKIGEVAEGKTVVGLIADAQAAAEAAAAQDAAAKVDELAKGAVAQNAADIDKLEEAVAVLSGDEGTIAGINAAIAQEVADREAADALINEKFGADYDKDNTIAAAIAQAQTDAEANAKTETEKQVKALADGAVATNASEISRVEGKFDDYVEAQAELAHESRIAAMEAFFEAADHDGEDGGLTDALDTLVEIQTFLSGEGSEVKQMLDAIDANADAIEALQDIVKDGGTLEVRVDQAESAIDALEGEVDALQALTAGFAEGETVKAKIEAAAALGQQGIDDAAAAKKAADDADAKAQQAQDEVDALEGVVSGVKTTAEDAAALLAQITGEGGRLTVAEGEIDALQADSHTHANKAELDKIAEGDKAKWDEAYDKRHEHANKAELDLIASGDKAKWDAAAVTAGQAAADLAALVADGGRIDTAESAIEALEAIVSVEGANSNAQLRADIEALEAIVVDGADGNVALGGEIDALAAKVNDEKTGLAATKAIADEAKSDAEDAQSRVAAIEGDYLKAADLFIINCGSATEVIHTAE